MEAARRQWHIIGVNFVIDLCHPHSISHLLARPRPTSDQILIGKYSFRIVMSSHATIHVASELNTTSIGRLVNQISQEHVMLDLFDTNYRCPSIWPKWRKAFFNLILHCGIVFKCFGFLTTKRFWDDMLHTPQRLETNPGNPKNSWHDMLAAPYHWITRKKRRSEV